MPAATAGCCHNGGTMKLRDAYRVYVLSRGASVLFSGVIGTASLVYQVEVVRLDPLQLVLVGTMLESVYFLCQVPTGLFADVYSRRLSIVIGYMLTGAGFMLEGAIPHFDAILLAQVIWGVGAACTDGATEAWIAGEVGEQRIGGVFLRGAQVGQVGGVVGVLLGMGLGSVRLNLPIILGGGLFVALGVVLAFTMPERGFHPPGRVNGAPWRALGETLRRSSHLVRQQPVLLTILAVAAFYGMGSEGFDRLSTAHFLTTFSIPAVIRVKPVVWLGAIAIGARFLNVAATEIVHRRLDMTRHRRVARTLFMFNAVRIVGVVGFGLVPQFSLALLAYWTAAVMRGTGDPIYSAWLTRTIDPQVRATVLSMGSQVDALGQIAGGPAIGVIGTFASLRAAMVASGAVLIPALLLFARAGRKGEVMAALAGEELPRANA